MIIQYLYTSDTSIIEYQNMNYENILHLDLNRLPDEEFGCNSLRPFRYRPGSRECDHIRNFRLMVELRMNISVCIVII